MVESGAPSARKKLERLQAEYRKSGTITRYYGGEGSVQLVEAGARPGRPRSIERQKTVGQRRPRPSWQLGDKEELSYRDVELRENFVSYKVDVTPYVREAILDEIRRAHRDAGEEIEAAGWLFAPYRPRAESDSSRSFMPHDPVLIAAAEPRSRCAIRSRPWRTSAVRSSRT